MLGKCWTGAYCKYFQNGVLPLNPEQATLLIEDNGEYSKPCVICGALFIPEGRKIYCSNACREKGSRKMERMKKRKQRRNKR